MIALLVHYYWNQFVQCRQSFICIKVFLVLTYFLVCQKEYYEINFKAIFGGFIFQANCDCFPNAIFIYFTCFHTRTYLFFLWCSVMLNILFRNYYLMSNYNNYYFIQDVFRNSSVNCTVEFWIKITLVKRFNCFSKIIYASAKLFFAICFLIWQI